MGAPPSISNNNPHTTEEFQVRFTGNLIRGNSENDESARTLSDSPDSVLNIINKNAIDNLLVNKNSNNVNTNSKKNQPRLVKPVINANQNLAKNRNKNTNPLQ